MFLRLYFSKSYFYDHVFEISCNQKNYNMRRVQKQWSQSRGSKSYQILNERKKCECCRLLLPTHERYGSDIEPGFKQRDVHFFKARVHLFIFLLI